MIKVYTHSTIKVTGFSNKGCNDTGWSTTLILVKYVLIDLYMCVYDNFVKFVCHRGMCVIGEVENLAY